MTTDAAAALDRVRDSVAARTVSLTYAALPDYARTLDAIGRQRCEEDARFHVRFLVGSLAVGDENVFVDYAKWAAGLLRGYGVDAENLATMLRATGKAIADLAPAAAEAASLHLEAGARAIER